MSASTINAAIDVFDQLPRETQEAIVAFLRELLEEEASTLDRHQKAVKKA